MTPPRGLLDERRDGEDRREDFDPDRMRITMRTAAAAIFFIAGLLVTYFASVNTVNARVSVLESQQRSYDQTIQRIEQKVDRLLERAVR